MWLHDLPQDAILALSTATSLRQPILLIGFIESDSLRQLAALPSHRIIVNLSDRWQDEERTQLAPLLQSEAGNLAAPRVTLVASNAPPSLLSNLFKLPKGWVASTISLPGALPEGIVAFNLRTKTFVEPDAEQLVSPYLHALVAGTEPRRWKLILQTALRLAAAKAQSLVALMASEASVEETLSLLSMRTQAELDFCVSLARADYALDLRDYLQQASAILDRNRQQPCREEVGQLRDRLERLQKETLHLDDVRAMLSGIIDSLVARGVPLELLMRTLRGVLPEWVSFPVP